MKTKNYILRELSQSLNLVKVENFTGLSFMLDCSFYETEIEDVCITDYDINHDEDLEKKDLVMLFSRKPGVFCSELISTEVLKDKELFKHTLQDFKNQL